MIEGQKIEPAPVRVKKKYRSNGSIHIDAIPWMNYPEFSRERDWLIKQKIKTCNKILKKFKTQKGRLDFSKLSGLPTSTLLDLANAADLLRVKGLGSDYVKLLLLTGTRTLRELQQKNFESLHKKLLDYNDEHKAVLFAPSLAHVRNFLEEAKKLNLLITY